MRKGKFHSRFSQFSCQLSIEVNVSAAKNSFNSHRMITETNNENVSECSVWLLLEQLQVQVCKYQFKLVALEQFPDVQIYSIIIAQISCNPSLNLPVLTWPLWTVSYQKNRKDSSWTRVTSAGQDGRAIQTFSVDELHPGADIWWLLRREAFLCVPHVSVSVKCARDEKHHIHHGWSCIMNWKLLFSYCNIT